MALRPLHSHSLLLPGPEVGKWATLGLRTQQEGLWEAGLSPCLSEQCGGGPCPLLQAKQHMSELGLERDVLVPCAGPSRALLKS